MEQNVGETDKLLRYVAGAMFGIASIAILLGVLETADFIALIFGLAAIVLLGTAILGYCGLYALLGIDTCDLEQQTT